MSTSGKKAAVNPRETLSNSPSAGVPLEPGSMPFTLMSCSCQGAGLELRQKLELGSTFQQMFSF